MIMASAVLHIKDSYYFEVPKFLWPAEYEGLRGTDQFDDYLVRLDQEFLEWQAKRIHARAGDLGLELPEFGQLSSDYRAWLHHGHNAGRPISVYLEKSGVLEEKLGDADWARQWEQANIDAGNVRSRGCKLLW